MIGPGGGGGGAGLITLPSSMIGPSSNEAPPTSAQPATVTSRVFNAPSPPVPTPNNAPSPPVPTPNNAPSPPVPTPNNAPSPAELRTVLERETSPPIKDLDRPATPLSDQQSK